MDELVWEEEVTHFSTSASFLDLENPLNRCLGICSSYMPTLNPNNKERKKERNKQNPKPKKKHQTNQNQIKETQYLVL